MDGLGNYQIYIKGEGIDEHSWFYEDDIGGARGIYYYSNLIELEKALLNAINEINDVDNIISNDIKYNFEVKISIVNYNGCGFREVYKKIILK